MADGPAGIRSWDDFAAGLRDCYVARGRPSFRDVALRSRVAREISVNTARNLALGLTRPQRGSAEGFLRGCGLDRVAAAAWMKVWDALAAADRDPSPAPVLPASLRGYLDAVQRAAENQPYTIDPDNQPPMAMIRLRRRVSSRRQPQSPRPAERSVTGDPDDQTRPAEEEKTETADAADVLAHRVALLVGPAGAGKSTLLHDLAGMAAKRWQAAPGPEAMTVPILVSARGLAAAQGPLRSALAGIAGAEMGDHLDQPLPERFGTAPPVPGASWLVLVDGFDEVLDPEQRRALRERLSRELSADPGVRLILTSRPLPVSELAIGAHEAQHFKLVPLDAGQLTAFAIGWFRHAGLADPERSADQVLARSDLRQLCRTPLMAAMACALHVRDPGQRLPTGRAALYRDFLHTLLHSRERRLRTREQIREQLSGCADGDAAADRLFEGRRELIERLAADAQGSPGTDVLDVAVSGTAHIRPAAGVTDRQWRVLVRDLLIHTGVLAADGPGVRFTHHTFQEFLAASYEAARLDPDGPSGPAALDPRDLDGARRQYLLFRLGLWSLDGYDFSPAARHLLGRGRRHVLLVATILAEGVPLAPDCVRALIDELRVIGRRQAQEVAGHLDVAAPYLPEERVVSIAESADFPPAVRLAMARALSMTDLDGATRAARTLSQDVHADISDRVDAAAALQELGRPDQAAVVLRRIAADSARPDAVRVTAAVELASCQAEDEAAALLRQFVAEADATAAVDAAEALSRFDTDEAAERLVELAQTPDVPIWDRHTAADALTRLDRLDEASTIYRAVLSDPAADTYDRAWSAERLLELGHEQTALAALAAIHADRGANAWNRVDTAVLMAKHGGRAEAETTLREIAGNPGFPADDRVRAIDGLNEVAGRAEAVSALGQLMGSPPPRREGGVESIGAACLRFGLPGGTDLLIEAALDPALLPWTRVACAQILDDDGQHPAAVAAIKAVIADPSVSASARADALIQLHAFDRDVEAVHRLLLDAVDPLATIRGRLSVLTAMHSLIDEPRLADHVRSVAYDPAQDVRERTSAARALQDVGSPGEGAGVLKAILAEADHAARTRIDVASALADRDPALALAVLRGVIEDGGFDDAVAALEAVPCRDSVAVLTTVAGDPDREPMLRFHAATAALEINSRSFPIREVLSLAEAVDLPAPDRLNLARLLHKHGAAPAAVSVLQAVGESGDPQDLESAADQLVSLGQMREGVRRLWRVVQENHDGSVQVDACRTLMRLGHRGELIDWLRHELRDGRRPVSGRAALAMELIVAGESAEGRDILTTLIDAAPDPTEVAGFLDVADRLAKPGAEDLYRRAILDARTESQVWNAASGLHLLGLGAEVLDQARTWIRTGHRTFDHIMVALRAQVLWGPDHEVVALLRSLAEDAALAPGDRVESLAVLHSVPGRSAEAVARLRVLAADDTIPADDREQAADRLRNLLDESAGGNGAER